MSDTAALERGYRRILAWYPRSFRAENEDEVLAVLLATAEEGQTRVSPAEAWDLLRGATRMRLWPVAPRPRSVRAAVKLMLAGAVAELAGLITVLVTSGAVRAAVAARDPAAMHALMVHQVSAMVGCPIAIGLWVWLASANGKGKDWARITATTLCAVGVLGAFLDLGSAIGGGRTTANLIMGPVVAGIGLVSICLLWQRSSNAYFLNSRRPRP